MNYKTRCEDCTECIKKNGLLYCHEMWDKPIEEVADCPLEIEVEEVVEINSKKIKVDHGASAEKERKPRTERKPDEEKIELIARIAEKIAEIGLENVNITNKTKIIEFDFGDNHFKLDLIRQRKPKK